MTETTIEKFQNKINSDSERVITIFLFETFARIEEAIYMTADQLPDSNQRHKADNYLVRLYTHKSSSDQKTICKRKISFRTLRKIEAYHLTPEYLQGIKSLGFSANDPKRPVFLNPKGHPWSGHAVKNQIRTALNHANFPEHIISHRMLANRSFNTQEAGN